MSERTFTVSLTGPQYRALASAVAEHSASLSADGEGRRDTQTLATLERAWNRVQAGWNLGGASYKPRRKDTL